MYAAVIVFGYFKKQKSKKLAEKTVSSNMTASETANKILLSSSLFTEDEIIEQEEQNAELNEEVEEDEPTRRRFNFAGSQREEEIVKEEKIVSLIGTEIIEDENDYIDINYGEKKVQISKDIYNSTSVTDVGEAAYYASKLIAEYNKPFRFTFISFITFLPKLIIQIGWLICAAYIVGALPLTETAMFYVSIAIMVSFGFSLLNILYPKYIATKALNRMVKHEIITEKEIDDMNIVVSSLAESEITNCFGFLKFFLRKVMGYGI